MAYNHSAQRAALTRAEKTKDPNRVIAACREAVRLWNANYWPDDWSRWQRALADVGIFTPLEEL